MLRNYFKIAYRNLTKQKGYSFINTAGLSVGMGICLFLVLISQYAFTFDQYHENSERIYRLADKIKQNNGNILDVAISPSPWGEAMVESYPEIEASVRFLNRSYAVEYEDKILVQGITYVDEPIFNVFSYPFKFGNPDGALDQPNSIVLTEEMSIRYFGDENPVGEVLMIDQEPYEITGVLERLSRHSSFLFNSLASFSSLSEEQYTSLYNWNSHNLYTYLLLSEDANIDALEANFSSFIETNVGEEYVDRYFPHLQPLADLHLFSNLYAEHGTTLEVSYVYIFSAIGLLILIIACINFINMATAQGLKRAKEVGVRKVMGAIKGQLIFQFLAEAFILSIVGAVLALIFVELALPWFNSLTEWEVEANYLSNSFYVISIFGIIVLVGLLAGAYPAFVLSAFKPASVLKSENTPTSGRSKLKTSLVVTQFTVAIFMIISTISVNNQIEYLKNKDLGFNTNDLMVSGIPETINAENIDFLRDELFKVPGVSKVSFSSNTPGEESGARTTYYPEGQFAEDGLLVNQYTIDDHFLDQFELTLLEGRDFSSELTSDSRTSIIINEAAAKRFGWDDPIGKSVIQRVTDSDPIEYSIIGVVKDFNYETLHSSVNPLIMVYNPNNFFDITIRLNTADVSAVTAQITETLTDFNNGVPMWYYFLEDDIADSYDTEEVISEMLTYFTYLTIFIACLGLLGLVSFTIINRRKEIGIRKVLGASISNIIQSISFHFLRLVIIGFLIGAPLAYVLINQWLNSFAYSTSPGVFTLILSGLSIVMVTLITIGFQTIKAALENPVKSLKSE